MDRLRRSLLDPPLQRAVGALTAAYGVSAIARPSTLARWSDLDDPRSPDRPVRMLSATIGVRDVCSGASILLAPVGAPLRAALVARALLDASDAAVFGLVSPSRRGRVVIAAVALAWGGLAAAAAVRTPRG